MYTISRIDDTFACFNKKPNEMNCSEKYGIVIILPTLVSAIA